MDECLRCDDYERAIRIYRDLHTPTYDRLVAIREQELATHKKRCHKAEEGRT